MNKQTTYWVILGVVIFAACLGSYSFYQNTRPCVKPIYFAIGQIDPRFGTTQSALMTVAQSAANIWNSAEKRDLLLYDPHSNFKINLIYDSREATAKLGIEIANEQATEDSTRGAIGTLQAQFTAAKTAFNQEVDSINASGGANKEQLATLTAQRDALKTLGDSINNQVAQYNASAEALNIKIDTYNKTAGHTFEEGEYVREAGTQRIDIFEFIDRTQLERVLAHEFGHALGLEHNNDPASIMYPKNESGNLTPSSSDLSELRNVCGS